MSAVRTSALNFRVCWACLVTVGALIAWCGDASTAAASCGDYLMPLHSGHAGDRAGHAALEHPADSMPGAVFPWAERAPQRPCEGPSCGQSPERESGLTGGPERSRGGSSPVAFCRPDSPEARLPLIDRRLSIELPPLEGRADDSLFRPPAELAIA